MITPTEPIPERELAERLGIARFLLRAMRAEHLQSPEHFVEKKSGVVFTPRGLEALLDLLAKKKEGAPAHDDGAGLAIAAALAAGPKKEPRVFYVLRLVPNPRVLLATPDRARKERPVRIRVRDAARYAVGMEIAACARTDGGWQIFGPPPRRRSQRSAVPGR